MALTSVTVEKKSVTKVMDGQWSVTFTLKGFDGATPLFEQDFTEDYKTGDVISRVQAGFIEKMQKYIDDYKSEQTLYNHALMDSSVTVVQSGLEV